ncbi:hypothetical protein BaRGS_00002821 [Batillaria attramentaria]|uniref:Uncharacterized protein n=1 Tax=Batillaria attramentaria TaxID=370345 RepID=A0ABD0M2Q9_9CAEN|nr:hypothetical protein BaRGS_007746 [Batillaria attramentaria]
MARVLVEKQVLFSGIWRPRHSLDDVFLRTVSKQFLEKPAAQATWRLTNEGLTILASQSESGRQGRTDQIPVTAIKEVTVNRYNPLCLMTLYVDPTRRFNAMVCKCETEQDASEIMAVFRELQRSLSGEGYRIDLKQPRGMNWMLKTKQNGDHHVINGHDGAVGPGIGFNNNHGELVVETEEELLEREELDVDGRHLYNVGVQAELGDYDSDRESTASDMSLQSLKDELYSLSSEVRDIKMLLERSTGISTEEYFRRMHDDPSSPRFVPVQRTTSTESEGNESGSGEKKVNFAEGEDVEFDIRSVGMQTDSKGRWKYQKRNHGGTAPARYKQAYYYRSRSGSNPGSPVSPNAPVSPALSYDGGHQFAYVNQGHRIVDLRRDPRFGSGSVSRGSTVLRGSTVVRPIESVYHVHTPGSRNKRHKIVVMPRKAATMPVRREPAQRSSLPVTTDALKSPPPTGNGVAAKPAVDNDAVDVKPVATGNGVAGDGTAATASQ